LAIEHALNTDMPEKQEYITELSNAFDILLRSLYQKMELWIYLIATRGCGFVN